MNVFQIVRVFFDADSGAMPIEARLQGRAMLEALRQKLARVVIVLALDRLSRNEIHAHVIWQSWVRNNIELHFVQGGKQENTAEAKLMFGVTAGVAAYERAKIRARTVLGKRANVESGRWPGWPAHLDEPAGLVRRVAVARLLCARYNDFHLRRHSGLGRQRPA